METTRSKVLVVGVNAIGKEHFRQQFAAEGITFEFADCEQLDAIISDAASEYPLIILDKRESVSIQHGDLDHLLEKLAARNGAPVVFLTWLRRLPAHPGNASRTGDRARITEVEVEELRRFVRSVVAQPRTAPSTGESASRGRRLQRQRARVIRGASLLSNRQNSLALDKVILAALRLKNEASAPWRHQIPLPSDFENYVDGWNASDAVLRDANEHGRLLYINLDLGSGCTLNCPHCFTMDGEIDSRGRDSMPYNLLKERILEAKELGLVAVRILGRGEPTEWVATNRSIETGGDFLDFIEFLSQHQIVPVVFTRGQVIGNDADALRFYKSTRRISSGLDLLNLLHRTRCSVFLGFSSIFSDINNEMVGRGQQADYDTWCRTAFKRCIQMGFNTPNPTRLAVESPITTLNIVEMPVRYVLFQLLNISPCSNVYMATGRMRALGLERISDPDQHAFVAVYAAITHFARRLGITGRIGPYPGTKECHDVSNGLYLTLNGDVYPCPGYESIQTILGSARDHTIKSIWQNNPLGRHPQSICPPKTGIHFPPSFGRTVEEELRNRRSEFDEMFQRICEGLHVPIRAGAGASRRSDEKAPNLGAKSNEVRND